MRDRQRPLHVARRQLAEEHVRDRRDDVKVLGQREQAQEDQDRDAVHPPAHLADRVRGGAAQTAERRGHQRGQRREVALVAVDVEGDEVTGVVEQAADHDQQNQDEDQHALPVRLLAIAPLGAAEPEQPRRVDDHPPPEHVEDADDHARLDQVAGDEERRAERLVGPEPRNVPVRVERPAEQRDHLEHQDDEAPEDQRVHDSRRLLARQELLLPEPVDDQPPDPLGDPIEARRRPRGQQQPRPEGDDPGEHQQRDPEQDRKDDVAHAPIPLRSSKVAVSRRGWCDAIRLFPWVECGELLRASGPVSGASARRATRDWARPAIREHPDAAAGRAPESSSTHRSAVPDLTGRRMTRTRVADQHAAAAVRPFEDVRKPDVDSAVRNEPTSAR